MTEAASFGGLPMTADCKHSVLKALKHHTAHHTTQLSQASQLVARATQSFTDSPPIVETFTLFLQASADAHLLAGEKPAWRLVLPFTRLQPWAPTEYYRPPPDYLQGTNGVPPWLCQWVTSTPIGNVEKSPLTHLQPWAAPGRLQPKHHYGVAWVAATLP